MREIMDKVHEILGEVDGHMLGLRVAGDSNCGSGSANFETYLDSPEYNRLLQGASNINIICIGGNDLDSADANLQRLKDNLLAMVRNLTALGRIVYVVESPRRHTVRRADLRDWHTCMNAINRYCIRTFRGRYIKLPTDGENMYDVAAFRPQDWGRGIELVHLRDDLYYEYARHILRCISTDLGLWM